jgi:Na+/H+ antiporter subunit
LATLLVEIASWLCILLGSFFTLVGAFGLVRMPEVFTRMHAASVVHTPGVGFLILGLALQAGVALPFYAPRQCSLTESGLPPERLKYLHSEARGGDGPNGDKER